MTDRVYRRLEAGEDCAVEAAMTKLAVTDTFKDLLPGARLTEGRYVTGRAIPVDGGTLAKMHMPQLGASFSEEHLGRLEAFQGRPWRPGFEASPTHTSPEPSTWG